MTTFIYYAYGSNLLRERLQARCPSANFIGIARADGYSLDFSKTSRDGSGKATIFRKANESVSGALFEIEHSELHSLDKAEGEGTDYQRLDGFKVSSQSDGSAIDCITYQAYEAGRDLSLTPYDWYHQLVVAGLEQHNFPKDYLEKMNSVSTLSDPDHARKSKTEALRVLKNSGYPFKPHISSTG